MHDEIIVFVLSYFMFPRSGDSISDIQTDLSVILQQQEIFNRAFSDVGSKIWNSLQNVRSYLSETAFLVFGLKVVTDDVPQ